MKTYETMFVLDAGNPDFESASAPVREVLTRIKAEVLAFKPWDERKLAYPINGRKRGLYVLAYFKANPLSINELQHEVELNEKILRALVLAADDATPEVINAETPATTAAAHRPATPEAAPAQAAPAVGAPAGETPPAPAATATAQAPAPETPPAPEPGK